MATPSLAAVAGPWRPGRVARAGRPAVDRAAAGPDEGPGEPGRRSRAHEGDAYGCCVPALTRFASPHRPGPPRLTWTPTGVGRPGGQADHPSSGWSLKGPILRSRPPGCKGKFPGPRPPGPTGTGSRNQTPRYWVARTTCSSGSRSDRRLGAAVACCEAVDGSTTCRRRSRLGKTAVWMAGGWSTGGTDAACRCATRMTKLSGRTDHHEPVVPRGARQLHRPASQDRVEMQVPTASEPHGHSFEIIESGGSQGWMNR